MRAFVLASDARGRHYAKNRSRTFERHRWRIFILFVSYLHKDYAIRKRRGLHFAFAEKHIFAWSNRGLIPQPPRPVTVEAAQEFRLLHKFTDVAGRAAVSLCWSRGETRSSVTIFGSTACKSADLWFFIWNVKHMSPSCTEGDWGLAEIDSIQYSLFV